jgi:hypothetical protein
VPPPPVEKTPPPPVEKTPPPPAEKVAIKYPKEMGALVVNAPAGTVITINGKKMPFKAPTDPLFFRPGSYRIKLDDPASGTSVKQAVEIVKGEPSEIVLTPGDTPAPPPDAPPPPPSKKRKAPTGEDRPSAPPPPPPPPPP